MQTKFIILIAFFLVLMAIYVLKRQIRHKKRAKLYLQPFPQEWVEILKKHFELYNKLPPDLRRQLHGHINIFLAEKNFVGYQGIEINDTIRVVIAAQACILLLNRRTNYYPHLHNILVYPNTFTHASQKSQQIPSRLGESWKRGPIVLSWQHADEGGINGKDGKNVIMHEFAHQLDQENDMAEGLPELQKNNIKEWSHVLSKEFNTLKLKHKLRKHTFLDQYGATNPAEFFAVITEQFIEQPIKFYKTHPELYKELQIYYQIDPREWVNHCRGCKQALVDYLE